MNANNIVYFDSFGVEHIPKETKKIIENITIITTMYRIHAYDSIMCVYFCIGSYDFMLKGKNLLDYTKFFSPNDYKKNNNVMLTYFR